MFRQPCESLPISNPPLHHHLVSQQGFCHRLSLKMMQRRHQSFVCRYESGGAMMTDFGARPPFVAHDYFLETAFELRFQGLLRSAWEHRTWHVIAALPGSGKSLGIADFLHQSNSSKNARGMTHMPVLAIRAPKNGGKDLALGMALSPEFGLLPTMSWQIRRSWLIQAMADGGTECIIIDDAQDLNLAHLAFLKEITDNLAAPPHTRPIGLCLVTAHS